MLTNALYTGWVAHERYQPHGHRFQYPLAMVMLDVDQLEHTLAQSKLWSLNKFNLISINTNDYLPSYSGSLKQRIQHLISDKTGQEFDGKVFLLTHPRYCGFVFNPVSFFVCMDELGNKQFIVSEITNTPWLERHCYVHQIDANLSEQIFEFDKAFHVSPFMPMQLRYRWRFLINDKKVRIDMRLLRDAVVEFDAVMDAQAEILDSRAMRRLPIQFPLQTCAVVWRIYWQALRLWLKKTPFYSNPSQSGAQQ